MEYIEWQNPNISNTFFHWHFMAPQYQDRKEEVIRNKIGMENDQGLRTFWCASRLSLAKRNLYHSLPSVSRGH